MAWRRSRQRGGWESRRPCPRGLLVAARAVLFLGGRSPQVAGVNIAIEGRTPRPLQLERLEDRIVLSSLSDGELFGPYCTPMDADPVRSAVQSMPIYGPLPQHGSTVVLPATLAEDLVPAATPLVAYLQPPVMRGLTLLPSSIAAAVAAAWEVPVGAQTDSWVIGLADGQTPESLSSLHFQTFTPTPFLPNAFIAASSAAVDIAGTGYDIASLDVVNYVYPQIAQQLSTAAVPNDPLFGRQWHLQNTGQTGGTVGADANVVGVWDIYKGSGSVIAVVDDGLQHAHPDLAPNYNASLSYDFNGNDPDPSPASSAGHGTAVGGVAAARGNNLLGVSGAAPEADLAGLRLLGGSVTDETIANALSYENQSIDIYSNSWMPDGYGVIRGDWPQTLAAIESNVVNGRGGLGNIYVYAAGNGLQQEDNVNYNGLANSRYTIAVAAVDHRGIQSSYSGPGAPLLVAAYSNGGGAAITTTTLVGRGNLADPEGSFDYTSSFGGTSSATPLVSGVIALMLEANPDLTWRDVQHVLVNSARHNHSSDSGWDYNGAGHLISYKYGFGAIDAQAAVDLALAWPGVIPEVSASSGVVTVDQAIADNDPTGITSTVNIPEAICMEQIEVVLSATHADRGDLRVVLTSPSGTESVLAETRDVDDGANYNNWVFTSTRHWDELSAGDWSLTVIDAAESNTGTFDAWQLNIYGTPPAPTDLTVTPSSITENTDTSGGDVEIGTLTPTDVATGDTYTYSLVAGDGDTDNGSFVIVGDKLLVQQGTELDFETQAAYSVRVNVNDGFSDFAKALTVSIDDLPEVEQVSVGDGSEARSMVTQVVVTFDQILVLDAGVFSVQQRGATGGPVDVSYTTSDVGGKTVATLTFSGAFVESSGSLADGNYDLTIDATKARTATDVPLDGDRDGTAGETISWAPPRRTRSSACLGIAMDHDRSV